MELYKKYGYAIVPKGTTLYRAHRTTDIEHGIFFTLQNFVAVAFHNGASKIEVWTVVDDFKVLFLVNEVDRRSWIKSAIVDLYDDLYPNDCNQHDHLFIKHFDQSKRRKLIDKLKDENIIGWLSSLEDKIELEICLFADRDVYNEILHFNKLIDKSDSEYDYVHALNKIEIFPGNQFSKRMNGKLSDRPYEDYKKMVDRWIRNDMKFGITKDQARQYNLDLRTKLRV